MHLPVPPRRGAGAYLDIEAVIRPSTGRADASGWAGPRRDPGLRQALRRGGLTFIGPSAEAMDLAGDKVRAKPLAEQHDVPVVP